MQQAVQRWEYFALSTAAELRTHHLNRYGEEGWELVATVPVGTGLTYYVFKRPKAPDVPGGEGEARGSR